MQYKRLKFQSWVNTELKLCWMIMNNNTGHNPESCTIGSLHSVGLVFLKKQSLQATKIREVGDEKVLMYFGIWQVHLESNSFVSCGGKSKASLGVQKHLSLYKISQKTKAFISLWDQAATQKTSKSQYKKTKQQLIQWKYF